MSNTATYSTFVQDEIAFRIRLEENFKIYRRFFQKELIAHISDRICYEYVRVRLCFAVVLQRRDALVCESRSRCDALTIYCPTDLSFQY